MKYIIEIEGFQLHSAFIIKELSIVASDLENHFFVKSPYSFDRLHMSDRRIVRYCENRLHKIYWSSGNDKFITVRDYLQELLNRDVDNIVYTKGMAKVNVLRNLFKLNCKLIDINTMDDNINQLWDQLRCEYNDLQEMTEQQCPLRFHKANPHCSHFKAAVISFYFEKLQHQDEQMLTEESRFSEDVTQIQRPDQEETH